MPRFSEVAMTSSGANEALLAAYAQHLATQPARTREAYLRDVGVLKALAGEAALTALPPAMLSPQLIQANPAAVMRCPGLIFSGV